MFSAINEFNSNPTSSDFIITELCGLRYVDEKWVYRRGESYLRLPSSELRTS